MLFKRRAPQRRVPNFLPHLPAQAQREITQDLSPAALMLRRWCQGIVISTPFFVAYGIWIRGWQDMAGTQAIAGVGAVAYLWAYCLVRSALHTLVLQRIEIVLWVNSVALAFIATVMLAVTGGSLSPLFWLYLVLIVLDALQDRRRGVMAAWLSCACFCLLIVAQALQWLPDEVTGVVWETHPRGAAWLAHAIGVAGWYVVVAMSVSAFSTWIGRYERQLRTRHAEADGQARALEAERATLYAEQQAVGQRTLQLDQVRHQVDADRQRWERERQQSDAQHAQAAQQLADAHAQLAEQVRNVEVRAAHLLSVQTQFDKDRTDWEQERTRMIKTLDDREADVREQLRECDDARRTFETQRAQTTQSLMQLEATLLASLKRVGEEMSQVEAKRRELEAAQRRLEMTQQRWTAQQTHVTQQMSDRASALALHEQRLADQQQAVTATADALRERLTRADAAERIVQQAHTAWETERAQMRARLEAAEAALARQDTALAEQRRAMAADAAQLTTQRSDVDAVVADLETRQRRTLEEVRRVEGQRHMIEQEQQRLTQELQRREQVLQERAAQLTAQRSDVEAARAQLAEQAAALDTQRRALSDEHVTWEQQRDRTAKAVSAAPRGLLGQAYRALQGQAKRLRDQGRELTQRRRDLAAREHQLEQQVIAATRQEHELQTARQQFEAERVRMVQQLRERELQLAQQLKQTGDEEHRVQADRVAVEQAKRELAAERTTHEATSAQRLTAQADEQRQARRELDAAQRAVAEAQQAHETQRTQWDAAQQRAQEAFAAREGQADEQRQALEEREQALARKCQEWEHTHGATNQRLTKEEKTLSGRIQALEAKEQRLAAAQQQADAERRDIERQQQQLTHASTKREQEHAVRLEHLEQLRKQLEGEREDAARQREQVEAVRQHITQEQQRLEETRRQVNEARRVLTDASMTQAPDRFSAETLTLLANEFNAPLASLHALLTTLMAGDHGEVSPAILTTLRDVDATHKRLSRVVSDVLDAARMEHGQFAVSIEQVVLHDILSRAEEEIQAEAERKHLTLSRQGNDTVTLAADREHLQRIFAALLRNAVQYTARGGITITASAEPERVTITIADTGVGIQTTALGRLFAKPKLGMLLRGKGMSLYLARGLATLMGGDVTLVSSDLEVGSTFAVTLPRQPRAAASEKPEPFVSVKR